MIQALLDYVKSNNEFFVVTQNHYIEENGSLHQLKCDQKIEFLSAYECVKRGLPRQHQVVIEE